MNDMSSGGDGALLGEIRQISRSLARLSTPVVPEGLMIGPLADTMGQTDATDAKTVVLAFNEAGI
jgi:hypothetical protein